MRRNLNLYVISESAHGKLEKTNNTIKRNIKNYLNQVRMISDSIDIFDPVIINIGIEFSLVAVNSADITNIMGQARRKIYNSVGRIPPQIGEPLIFSDVFLALKDIEGVLDVVAVRAVAKSGTGYGDYAHDISAYLSPDGTRLRVPHNGIWEIKNLEDITGTVRK